MKHPKNLRLLGIFLAVLGWQTHVWAEGEVTVISEPTTAAPAPKKKVAASDDTPVVHKSSHRKKKADASAVASTPSSPAANTPPGTTPPASASSPTGKAVPTRTSDLTPATATTVTAPASSTRTATAPGAKPSFTSSSVSSSKGSSSTARSVPAHVAPIVPAAMPPVDPAAAGPTVETGVPVARHGIITHSSVSEWTPVPSSAIVPSGLQNPSASFDRPLASIVTPITPPPAVASSTLGSYTPAPRPPSPADNFVFTNFNKKAKNIYPWRTNIITTMFYIGEGGSSVSPTTNIASAWDQNWRATNGGNDDPNNRASYGPADHAAMHNTFYVALPFNDLAYPDKARRYLPSGWHRPPRDGKEVSACVDRWVIIKNAQGRTCYAQWEDVGPLVSDDAEYVFGNGRPTSQYSHAGLDVSPAVAKYLSIENNGVTSWRFVDEEDVQPGAWLRYDELALLYLAMHQQKDSLVTPNQPIQRGAEPTDDPANIDANKKKVGAAKG